MFHRSWKPSQAQFEKLPKIFEAKYSFFASHSPFFLPTKTLFFIYFSFFSLFSSLLISPLENFPNGLESSPLRSPPERRGGGTLYNSAWTWTPLWCLRPFWGPGTTQGPPLAYWRSQYYFIEYGGSVEYLIRARDTNRCTRVCQYIQLNKGTLSHLKRRREFPSRNALKRGRERARGSRI